MDRPPLLDIGPWADVIAAAEADPFRCALHRAHQPRTLTLQYHYLHPLGMGGPDEQWNKITVCPTGHANVHVLMRSMHQGVPMRGGHFEQRIAQLGMSLWAVAGNPGGRVTLATETGEPEPEQPGDAG